MARVLHHLMRLCGCFTSHPTTFFRTLKSLPDNLDARAFANRFPEIAADGHSSGTNPLLAYFDGHATGPGIWKWRHYFSVYHRHLQRFVGTDAVVAEIGIFSGGSLSMWRNYFGPETELHGIDLDETTQAYATAGVEIHIGDQESRAFWRTFRERVPRLDVMIDDGGHSPQQQRVSLEEILPHLSAGGVYICEDITGDTNDFLAYVGGLVASLNAGIAAASSPATSFQKGVWSIHCYPFITVIERAEYSRAEFVSQRQGTEWRPPLVIRDGYGKIAGRGE